MEKIPLKIHFQHFIFMEIATFRRRAQHSNWSSLESSVFYPWEVFSFYIISFTVVLYLQFVSMVLNLTHKWSSLISHIFIEMAMCECECTFILTCHFDRVLNWVVKTISAANLYLYDQVPTVAMAQISILL